MIFAVFQEFIPFDKPSIFLCNASGQKYNGGVNYELTLGLQKSVTVDHDSSLEPPGFEHGLNKELNKKKERERELLSGLNSLSIIQSAGVGRQCQKERSGTKKAAPHQKR